MGKVVGYEEGVIYLPWNTSDDEDDTDPFGTDEEDPFE